MKIKAFIYLNLIVAILQSCQDKVLDLRLKVKNESSKTIIFDVFHDSIPSLKYYINPQVYYEKAIRPDSIRAIKSYGWEDELKFSHNGKVNLYFFDIDTLKKYGDMDTIVRNKLWIKQMSVSKEELEKNNWVVVFKE